MYLQGRPKRGDSPDVASVDKPAICGDCTIWGSVRKYEEALEYHCQAQLLCPHTPSTYSAIAYIHALTGNNALAVDFFHKALGLRRDDAFSTTMLSNVMEALMTEVAPVVGDVDTEPFTSSGRLSAPAPLSLASSLLDKGDDSSLAVPSAHTSSMMAIEDVDMDD
ncbi:hypothetical protein ACOMHN_019086 [Nucella lapillus]